MSSSSTTVPIDAGHAEQHQEKAELEVSEFGEAPDGGLQAWLVAAGGACIFFCCLGFSNSFGTFEQYYLTHQLQHEPPDTIAWIGSLSLFLQFAAGAFGGPLFDMFGPWVRRQTCWQRFVSSFDVLTLLLKSIRPAAVFYVFAMISRWYGIGVSIFRTG